LGYYLLSGLANGSYEITASKSGYETNSTTTTITGSNVEDVNILLTWIEPSSTSYIPYQIFILLVIVMITTTGYSFNTEDKSYYTDIITSLLSCLLSLLLAYYSFIGIGFNYALSASVEHEAYTLIPLGILFVCIAVIMLIFFIIKILELGHQELEEL
jgi:amino acid transporter